MRSILKYAYGFFLASTLVRAQEAPRMSFSRIDNGLFNDWISCIDQDNKGFIWVGTQDGLHRYDGYEFEIFRNSPEETPSLAANWIRDMAIDAYDNYWIGTYGGGLTKFSPKEMAFENLAKQKGNETLGKLVYNITAFAEHHIISSTEKGIQIHDTRDNSVHGLEFGSSSQIALEDDTLWLAEGQKLFSYDLVTQDSTHVYTFDSKIHLVQYLPDIGLVVSLDSELLVFKENNVLKKIALNEPVLHSTTSNKEDYFMATATAVFRFKPDIFRLEEVPIDIDTSKMRITAIFLDMQGILWIGTEKGLYREKKFNRAFLQEKIAVHARRITKHKGFLYLGGKGGLFKIKDNEAVPLIQGSEIKGLADNGETLMASGLKGAVNVFKNDKLHTMLPLSTAVSGGLSIYGLAKDKKNRLWMGSWEGLYVVDENGLGLNSVPLKSTSGNGEAKIINIHIDAKDRLWVITCGQGLYMMEGVSAIDLDTISSQVINYRNQKGDGNSLTSNIIMTLEEDEQGQMWFGTDIGVVMFREESRDFSRLRHQKKLFDKKVMAIRSDGNQNLWITTINDGIYVYGKKEKAFRHFTENDGLISDAFLFGSGYYDKATATLYFGTDEGVQKIDLSLPFSEHSDDAPIITAIQVHDTNGKTNIAPLQAPFLKKVSLGASQNDFSVRFSAMDFINAEKIQYAYTLDDIHWKTTDLQTAYFTNVPFGNHELKVKALYNGMNSGRKISTLEIYISPPWYYGRSAKGVYLLLLLATVWGVYRYMKWRWHIQLNLRLKGEEAERLKRLNDFKSDLYTNIAHEFKTPLTLISGPIDYKLSEENITDSDRAHLSIAKRNTLRLTSLVDQLLELAKLEDGKLAMNITKGDLALFLHTITRFFEYQATLKNISYTVEISSTGEVWYDGDIIEKITTNLLSNAFKYSPKNGVCTFSLQKNNGFAHISIKNTALNASKLQLQKMFTRFYQYDAFSEGVGVGLSLVKELVKVYGGTIDVTLEDEDVLHFNVKLPLRRKAFAGKANVVQNEPNVGLSSTGSPNGRSNLPNVAQDTLPLLLLVEDHEEIRTFIKLAFQKKYRILEAENGKTGMEIALSQGPDIILSDIRMPVKNGIDLCNALKMDERTSHIPIILLTASVGEEYELKGLTSGADDYVTKPFKIAVLERRLANLIEVRKALRNRYSQEFILKPKDMAITPSDEVFLNKVQQILDEHLSDPNFNAEKFCRIAKMSRMQLHRKLQVYTGLSTSAFIRSQRLKLALHILKASDLTINEVAYSVGFNTPTYFMKCFKETFKKTPSEYLQSTVIQ